MNVNDVTWWHRIQLPDGSYTPGAVHYGPDGGDWPTTRFGMPTDLTGKTVLDIGTYDGFFAFEAEKRGAKSVVAVDRFNIVMDTFKIAKDMLNSNVVYNGSFDVDRYINGWQFNVVLFYGVLYHLENPLLAMANVHRLTTDGGICLLETAMSTRLDNKIPALEYDPGVEGDPTNRFYPNEKWIEKAALTVGFTKCEYVGGVTNRSTYRLTK